MLSNLIQDVKEGRMQKIHDSDSQRHNRHESHSRSHRNYHSTGILDHSSERKSQRLFSTNDSRVSHTDQAVPKGSRNELHEMSSFKILEKVYQYPEMPVEYLPCSNRFVLVPEAGTHSAQNIASGIINNQMRTPQFVPHTI